MNTDKKIKSLKDKIEEVEIFATLLEDKVKIIKEECYKIRMMLSGVSTPDNPLMGNEKSNKKKQDRINRDLMIQARVVTRRNKFLHAQIKK